MMKKMMIASVMVLGLTGCHSEKYCLGESEDRVCSQFDADGECKTYVPQENIKKAQ